VKRIESIEAGENDSRLTLECGHAILTNSPNAVVGTPWECPACAAIERRKGLVLPKPEDVLDAITEEYVATMQAQGVAIGVPERAAIRRAANIQYAWFCAIQTVLHSQSSGDEKS
jgi:hypothetical protein